MTYCGKLLAIASTLISLAGCLTDAQSLTKEQAASMAKSEWSEDYCDTNSWYGDGECDAFCPRADSDCQGREADLGECRLTVDANDPIFARYEAPLARNNCSADSGCVEGGCSGEVCAAERVVTTCAILQGSPSGHCGCVQGNCIWYQGDCAR